AAEHAAPELAGGAEAARLEDVGHDEEEGAALDRDAEGGRFAHERVVEAVQEAREGRAEEEEDEAVPPLGDAEGDEVAEDRAEAGVEERRHGHAHAVVGTGKDQGAARARL